jgi:hypothetical protein
MPDWSCGPPMLAELASVEIQASGTDAVVSQVKVWDGPSPRKTFYTSWKDGALTRKTLDLGASANFNYGMEVSIKVTAGSDTTKLHSFYFATVGAFIENL